MFAQDDFILSYLSSASYYSQALGGMKPTPGKVPHVILSLNVPMAIILLLLHLLWPQRDSIWSGHPLNHATLL